MGLILNKEKIFLFLAPLGLGLITFFVLIPYNAGDRIVYAALYQSCAELSILAGYGCYVGNITTYEPFYYLIMLVGYELNLSHNFMMFLGNIFLIWAFLKFSYKNNINIYFAAFTVATNFYFWTLFTELERLKFCIGLFFWYQSSSKPFINHKLGPLAALLAHMQIAVIAIPMFLFRANSPKLIHGKWVEITSKSARMSSSVVLLLLIALLIYLQSEIFLSKFNRYFVLNKIDVSDVILAFAFFMFAITLLPKTVRNIAVFASIFFASLLIGGARVNLMYFFAYYVISAPIRLSKNYGLLLLTFYFFFKTLIFMDNFITTGRGFNIE